MNPCDDLHFDLLRYLDGELSGQELEHFRAHLKSCAHCTARLEEERELSNVLRGVRPLYTIPPEFRARILETIEQESPWVPWWRKWQGLALALALRWRVLVPASAVITLCLIAVPNLVQNARAASYVQTALATHNRYMNGALSPAIRSRSPEEITAWFVGKLPFRLRLPDSESTSDSGPTYHLAGASVVNYRGSRAGLVIYDAPNESVTLLVASSKSAVVAGGDEVHYGVLTFHYRSEGKFKVITWSNHGLSYALVSSITGSAAASCAVCHHNLAERDLFHARP
jgi:anti-sigma factor (TIGR02949 family)